MQRAGRSEAERTRTAMSENEVVGTWMDGVIDELQIPKLIAAQPDKNGHAGFNKSLRQSTT